MNSAFKRRDNFAYLTIALVVFMLLGALAHQFTDRDLGARLIEGAILLTMATGVWSVRTERQLFILGVVLTVCILLVSLVGFFQDSPGLTMVHVLLLLGFFLLTIWLAIKQVLFSGQVDGNAIVGAICIYLLLGMIWALLFMLVEEVAPGSFKGLAVEGGSANFMDLVYFSFISLTTMGYGDITPALPLARYLSFMEGVVGQFYVAILVASLVGVRVSNWQQK